MTALLVTLTVIIVPLAKPMSAIGSGGCLKEGSQSPSLVWVVPDVSLLFVTVGKWRASEDMNGKNFSRFK